MADKTKITLTPADVSSVALSPAEEGRPVDHTLSVGEVEDHGGLWAGECACGRWHAHHHPDRDSVETQHRAHVERREAAAAALEQARREAAVTDAEARLAAAQADLDELTEDTDG